MSVLQNFPVEVKAQILESLDNRVDLCNAVCSARLFKDAFRLQMVKNLYYREISKMQDSRGQEHATAYVMSAIYKRDNAHAALVARGAWQAMSPCGISVSLLPLAQALAAQYNGMNQTEEALAILEKCWQTLSSCNISVSILSLALALIRQYDKMGQTEKTLEIIVQDWCPPRPKDRSSCCPCTRDIGIEVEWPEGRCLEGYALLEPPTRRMMCRSWAMMMQWSSRRVRTNMKLESSEASKGGEIGVR